MPSINKYLKNKLVSEIEEIITYASSYKDAYSSMMNITNGRKPVTKDYIKTLLSKNSVITKNPLIKK